MEYFILHRDNWHRVAEVLGSFGQALPLHPASFIAVAEEDERIVSALCVQPQIHAEPWWVDPEYRGEVNLVKMRDSIRDILPPGLEYYSFAPNRAIRLAAGMVGMKPLPWQIWKGVL